MIFISHFTSFLSYKFESMEKTKKMAEKWMWTYGDHISLPCFREKSISKKISLVSKKEGNVFRLFSSIPKLQNIIL